MASRPAESAAGRAPAASAPARLPVTVVIPTLNEELNLPAALASVQWADQLVVVDSHSSDRTAEIARAGGAEVVQFSYPGWGPKKQNWALANLDFRNEWVLLLAADERVPPELQAEIAAALASGSADGYCLDRELVFLGRPLRCFRPNWNLRLFKHRLGRYEDLGLNDLPGTGDMEIHEHVRLRGRVGYLRSPLRHDDDRGLSAWLERLNRYATWEAHLYRRLRAQPLAVGPLGLLRAHPFERTSLLRRLWARLPGRPLLRFLWWYLARRGFLDGRRGFTFCVLMSYYEFIIAAKLRELEQAGSSG